MMMPLENIPILTLSWSSNFPVLYVVVYDFHAAITQCE